MFFFLHFSYLLTINDSDRFTGPQRQQLPPSLTNTSGGWLPLFLPGPRSPQLRTGYSSWTPMAPLHPCFPEMRTRALLRLPRHDLHAPSPHAHFKHDPGLLYPPRSPQTRARGGYLLMTTPSSPSSAPNANEECDDDGPSPPRSPNASEAYIHQLYVE